MFSSFFSENFQINGEYKNYGMDYPTFGWFNAQNIEIYETLMDEIEKFVRENKMKNVRGPFIQHYEIFVLIRSKN